ncbi:hypothetical protein [Streptomyces cylindrosporus]|uniref:Secreted protein n=1 Tax=Streptomyces cylindrosporus TaxID=2927583 RepID=A0ABS9YGZ6_9ACTN|nr:hypothetical protein [Streptomyces cylindrosporus]MCI3276523.1 hypothetical protein [Streptomyces cylindrosporus]
MSNTIAGLVGGVLGALLSALAMFLGPLAHQRQIARQERERGDRESARSQLQRVARVRTAMREWQDFLNDVLADIEAGRSVEVERFVSESKALRKEARTASDDLLGGGLWLGSLQFGAFDLVTRRLPDLLGGAFPDEVMPDLVHRWRENLHSSRAELNEKLLAYVDRLQDTPVDVIDSGPVRPPRA